MLKGKTVVLGVTGSIAAYKIAQRILVVEDHDDLREYLSHTLSEAYQVGVTVDYEIGKHWMLMSNFSAKPFYGRATGRTHRG